MLLMGIIIGIIITFYMKVSYHGVNSSWFLKNNSDMEIVLLDC